QVGVNAPGTANRTTFLLSNRVAVSMISTPSSMRCRRDSGIGSPGLMGMGVRLGWGSRQSRAVQPRSRQPGRRGLEPPPARLYPGHRGRGAAPDQEEVNMRHLTRYQSQWPARPVFQDEMKQVFDRFFRFEDDQDES